MKRQEIDEKYKWDLSDLCKSSKEFNSRIKKIPKLIDELAKYQGHLLDSSENLYNFLQEKDKVEEEIFNFKGQEYLELYSIFERDESYYKALKFKHKKDTFVMKVSFFIIF